MYKTNNNDVKKGTRGLDGIDGLKGLKGDKGEIISNVPAVPGEYILCLFCVFRRNKLKIENRTKRY